MYHILYHRRKHNLCSMNLYKIITEYFLYLICAHQTAARADPPNKRNNISIFDNLDVRKYFIEIGGQRYPRHSVLTNYAVNDSIDQYRDLKIFYKEYVGEELLNPFVSYPDMKNKYPIQVIDLRLQTDHKTP